MYCNKFIVPENLWPHTNTHARSLVAHIYIILIFPLQCQRSMCRQALLLCACAICRWVCFMDLKHFEHRLHLTVCATIEIQYCHTYIHTFMRASICFWKIGVLSIHTIKTKHLSVQCTYMCSKTSTNKWFSACFLSLLLLSSLMLGHLRQHKHEYKWLSSQRQEKRVEMKWNEKKIAQRNWPRHLCPL